jgi:hypothetical protein
LDTWIQNSDIGVSKETYLEMCEMLGTEPNIDEMPPDLSDFSYEVQQAIQVFGLLKDVWDPFGGNYMGKDLSIIFQIFDILQVEKCDTSLIFKIVQHLDYCRASLIKRKQDAKASQKPSGK